MDLLKVRALKSAIHALRERITDLHLVKDEFTFEGTFMFDLLAQNKITK
jgi:hypothetical protein